MDKFHSKHCLNAFVTTTIKTPENRPTIIIPHSMLQHFCDSNSILQNSSVATHLPALQKDRHYHQHMPQIEEVKCNLPCQMAEVTVCRACNDLAVYSTELLGAGAKRNDFCRAHKREVKRVEEQYHVFALVVIQ